MAIALPGHAPSERPPQKHELGEYYIVRKGATTLGSAGEGEMIAASIYWLLEGREICMIESRAAERCPERKLARGI